MIKEIILKESVQLAFSLASKLFKKINFNLTSNEKDIETALI